MAKEERHSFLSVNRAPSVSPLASQVIRHFAKFCSFFAHRNKNMCQNNDSSPPGSDHTVITTVIRYVDMYIVGQEKKKSATNDKQGKIQLTYLSSQTLITPSSPGISSAAFTSSLQPSSLLSSSGFFVVLKRSFALRGAGLISAAIVSFRFQFPHFSDRTRKHKTSKLFFTNRMSFSVG